MCLSLFEPSEVHNWSPPNTSRPSLSFAMYWYLRFLKASSSAGSSLSHPAGLIKAYRFPATGCIVFIQQTILNDLELQLSYRTNNLTAIELIDKQLCHTFIHQLVDTFCQLFLFHRISILDRFEHFRREAR